MQIRTPAIRIGDRHRVVALAQAICALPPMPRGALFCPMDVGAGFLLVFARPDVRWPPVTIHSSGCELVTGASFGRARWIPPTPGFWVTFSRLTGIKDPAHRP